MIISVFDRVENIVGKGEIACTLFSKGFFPRRVKRCHCVGWVNSLLNDKTLDWMNAFAENKLNLY